MKMRWLSGLYLVLSLFSTAAAFAQSSEWIPESFDKLKIGMSWSDAVSILPNATYDGGFFSDEAGADSKNPKDHPGGNVILKLASRGVLWVSFNQERVSSFRFSYPTKDVRTAKEVQAALEDRFGSPKSTAYDAKNKVNFYKWETPSMDCYLIVPLPESARGAALTVSVNSKEAAARADKSLTLIPYTKPAASTLRTNTTAMPTVSAEKPATGFPIVLVVILAAVITGLAVFFLRRKSP